MVTVRVRVSRVRFRVKISRSRVSRVSFRISRVRIEFRVIELVDPRNSDVGNVDPWNSGPKSL